MLYQIRDGSLSAGSETVLSHFEFEIKGRDRVAIVGPNGAGKTTLLRLISGELSLDRDDKRQSRGIFLARDTSIGILKQEAISGPDISVQELLLSACPAEDLWSRERFDYEQAYDRYFTGFGFQKEDKRKLISEFSGGERTKIALIRLLLEKPDILLLDEPTNHLDMETVAWLEQVLREYSGAVVMVSHDRFFLDEVAEITYEIEDHKLVRYVGGYTDYRKEKLRRIQSQQKAYERQKEEIERLEDLIKRFKNKPAKAAFARSRKKQIDRMEKILPPIPDTAHIFTGELLPAHPGPKWVLDMEELRIGYDRVLQEITTRVRRGQKIGIIGPNGSGKSTFLKTLTGQLQPLHGKYKFGEKVDIGYYDQMGSSVDNISGLMQMSSISRLEKPGATVLNHFLSLYPNVPEKDARHYLASYLFRGADAGKRVVDLSGGEKARLSLCEILYGLPNMLILDEPTNHMDIPARETLESAFQAYKGTILFVSHDRYFLQQVADALLIFENNTVSFYPFGYRHYLQRMKALQERLRLADLRERTQKKENTDSSETSGETDSGKVSGDGRWHLDELAGILSPEDAALAASLQKVPKGSSLLGRQLSDDQIFLEWQLRLAEEEMDQHLGKLEMLSERYISMLFTQTQGDEAHPEPLADQIEREDALYLKSCLHWYEIYAELHPEILELPLPLSHTEV